MSKNKLYCVIAGSFIMGREWIDLMNDNESAISRLKNLLRDDAQLILEAIERHVEKHHVGALMPFRTKAMNWAQEQALKGISTQGIADAIDAGHLLHI